MKNRILDYESLASLPNLQFHPILGPSTDAPLKGSHRFKLFLRGLFDAYCVNFPEISRYYLWW